LDAEQVKNRLDGDLKAMKDLLTAVPNAFN